MHTVYALFNASPPPALLLFLFPGSLTSKPIFGVVELNIDLRTGSLSAAHIANVRCILPRATDINARPLL